MKILRRIQTVLGVVALLVFAGGNTHATTIGFEGVAAPGSSLFLAVSPYSEAGFDLSFPVAGGFTIFDSAFIGTNTSNGTDILGWCGFCVGTPVTSTLSAAGGIPFSFLSIDATNLTHSSPTSPVPAGLGLNFTGHLNGGGTVTHSVTFTADTFVTFALPGFTNLLSVDITGAIGGTNTASNDFAIDNLVVNVASVPEPTTLAIFGFGLAGLGFLRRRRRTA